MSGGNSFESFAAVVGTCRRTLYDWEKRHPEFLHAKERGADGSLLFWENMVKAGSSGQLRTIDTETQTVGTSGEIRTEKKYRPASFNAVGAIFVMKNRFPDLYRDRQEIRHVDAGREDLSDRTPEEILDQAGKIMDRMRDSVLGKK
jgi:hypothetical protein